MKARIYVKLKKDVLDPQGTAVCRSLRELGYEEVASVRVGRFLEVELRGAREDARERVEEMCRRLLANPVIEDYQVELP
ncbi:MAG: phosphoribosylformylglycinamidine synthase subunit PurS [Acidobacteriota bacterium]